MIVVLIALSVAIQLIGIAVDLRTYEVRFLVEQAKLWGGIGQAIEALYLKPTYSPVLGHVRLLLAGTEPLDVAWVQHREMGTWAFVPQGLLASLLFVGLASRLSSLFGGGRSGPEGSQWAWPWPRQ